MNVELKNVGIVEHANIDLSKDLIILTGPNNTGKTYVAYVLYAIYKYPQEHSLIGIYGSSSIEDYFHKKNDLFFRDGKLTFKLDWGVISTLIEEVFAHFSNFLPNVFASENVFFINSKAKVYFNENEIESIVKNIKINYNIKFPPNLIVQIKKELNTNFIDFYYTLESKTDKFSNIEFTQILSSLADEITEIILNALFNNSYITPTERTAINLFSKEISLKRNEIVNKLLDHKTSKEQINILKEAKRYPLPIRDSLAIAEDLANLQKNKSEYSFIADAIESEILKGKIAVSGNGEVLFNPNNTKVLNLNIHLSASIVKSLSNLVFYFRHLAEKNDFIIIDEPELNLHPDNQIIMARLIAKIVNNGFKVLISTHSDYIVKELNNLIRLNEADKNLVEKYFEEYQSVDFLDKDKVGVYLFKDKKAINIPVDELGFEVSTIEKENNQLAEISERIYYEIFENKV